MPSPKDVEMNAIDVLNCWDETLRTNNRNALGQHLAPDFAFQMLGQNAMEQTSDEHLDWCTSDESPLIVSLIGGVFWGAIFTAIAKLFKKP